MVKITDVARHAGVSPSTVSYVLSGKRTISQDTRLRVQASIRTLGYRPHAGARALASRRTQVLALVAPLRSGVNVPVIMQFAASVVTTARGFDHDILLLTQEEGEAGLHRVAESALVDGLVVMDVQLHDARLPLLQSLGQPAVLIGLPADPTGLTCVDLDFSAAGALCVDHLASLGHRGIELIGSPPQVYQRQSGYAARLAEGFRCAAGRHGLHARVHPCQDCPEAAQSLVRRLLTERPGLSALVVHNESVLRPVLSALADTGRSVPQDVSVVAICPDDQAEQAPVPLTSVTVPAEEVGRQAVELLMAKLDGRQVRSTTLLAPRLTVRRSTAAGARVLA
jgi:DNA-binding LacI/PurR family transcriptional regulator